MEGLDGFLEQQIKQLRDKIEKLENEVSAVRETCQMLEQQIKTRALEKADQPGNLNKREVANTDKKPDESATLIEEDIEEPESNENTVKNTDKNRDHEISDKNSEMPSIREIVQKNEHARWKNIPKVAESQEFLNLTAKERQCQEAKFELITKEFTYLNQMKVLLNHYRKQIEYLRNANTQAISFTDFDIIFGYVEPIIECSEAFLNDLEDCLTADFMMRGLFEIILQYSKEKFRVYFDYNVNYQDAMVRITSIEKGSIVKILLELLESHKDAQKMSLMTYCSLPMAKIAKMALLLKTIVEMMDSDHEEFNSCHESLVAIQELVQNCNDAVPVKQLEQKFIFPPSLGKLSIVYYGQKLINKSNVKILDYTEQKLSSISAILLSDSMILAKDSKKGKGEMTVIDQYHFEGIFPVQTSVLKLVIYGRNLGLKNFEMEFSEESDCQTWFDHLWNNFHGKIMTSAESSRMCLLQ